MIFFWVIAIGDRKLKFQFSLANPPLWTRWKRLYPRVKCFRAPNGAQSIFFYFIVNENLVDNIKVVILLLSSTFIMRMRSFAWSTPWQTAWQNKRQRKRLRHRLCSKSVFHFLISRMLTSMLCTLPNICTKCQNDLFMGFKIGFEFVIGVQYFRKYTL